MREATGGKLKFAMNGGAAISKDTQEFLSVAIMPMMQGTYEQHIFGLNFSSFQGME